MVLSVWRMAKVCFITSIFTLICTFSSFASSGSVNLPQVDLFSGSLNYSVPIDVPPGRNGMQPNLSLTYNSSRRNGWVGVGWDLNVGAIQRNTKKGLDYSGNDFLLNGAVLVEVEPGRYQTKVENEFKRIIQDTAVDGRIYWEVTDKAGKRYIYGQVEASRQDDPANADRIFKWCLDKVVDTHGNTMTYAYTKDQGQIYLDRIDYTGNESAGTAPTKYVTFQLEARDDVAVSYTISFGVKTAFRLKSIDSGALSHAFSSAVLTYEDSPSSLAARLSKVELHDTNGTAQPISLAHLSYDQGSSPSSPLNKFSVPQLWADRYDSNFGDTFLAGYNGHSSQSFHFPGDFNGDGRTDFMYWSTNGWIVLLSEGSGFAAPELWAPRADPDYGDTFWSGYNGNSSQSFHFPGDFNGDGKTDFMYWSANGWAVLLSTGTSFAPPELWAPRSDSNYGETFWLSYGASTSQPFHFSGDYNGDGKTDFMYWKANKGWAVLLSTGSGFSAPEIWASKSDPNYGQTFWSGYDGFSSQPFHFSNDYNGDGKTDFMYFGSAGWKVMLSSGSGFETPELWAPRANADYGDAFWSGYNGNSSQPFHLSGDYNGDGKSDYMYWKNTGWTVLLSTGDGFATPELWASRSNPEFGDTFWSGYGDSTKQPFHFSADYNGDGKTDFMYWKKNTGWAVLLSTGIGFRPPEVRAPRSDSDYGDAFWSGYSGFSSQSFHHSGDYNGDGKTDFLYWGSSGWSLLGSGNESSGRLISVSLPLGATTTIDYTPSTAYQNTLLPYPVQTVSRITTDDANGVVSETNYEFSGGYHHRVAREFRGFNFAKESGPIGANGERAVVEMWFHQGNGIAVDANDPSVVDGYMRGKPYKKRVSDQNGKLLSEIQTTYTADADGVAPFFNPLAQVDSSQCDRDACGMQTRTGYVFDEFGNLTTEYRYGDVSTNTDDATLVKEYAINESKHIVALLAKETLYDETGNKKSQVDYYYDGPSDCSSPATSQVPVKANLSRIVRWLDVKTAGTPHDPESRMGYDDYGNQICTVDANGNKSVMEYDSSHTFPVKMTNALLHETITSYYGVDGVVADKGPYGMVKSIVDSNGATTSLEYDSFGRRTREALSGGSWQSWEYKNFGASGAQHVLSNNSFGLWSENYLDGMGRSIKKRSIAAEGKVAVELALFDARGNAHSVSMPHFEDETAQFVLTEFDASGRPLKVTRPDTHSGLFCYNDDVSVLIDANQHRRRETRNAQGKLVKVEEYEGTFGTCTTEAGTPYTTTTYNYDLLGNLLLVTDTKGNQSEMRYDSLGRKTYMDDPDMGVWTYDYDAKGNMVAQQDAKGQVINLSYDGLGRISVKDFVNTADTDVHYYYDEVQYGFAKGRLTRMTDESGETTFYYSDAHARSVTMTKIIDASSYSITTQTDALGRTVAVQYPDGKVAGYVYQFGSLKEVDYNGVTYASFSNYNAQGQMQKVTYGNGVVTDYSYQQKTGLLSTIQVKKDTTHLLNSDYYYDPKGNIKDIFNYVDVAKSQSFTYDHLDRLMTAQSGHYGSLAYSYDEIGNLTSKDGLTYIPDAQRPHAVGSISGGRSFSYDANGNMLTDGLRTYTWNADNKPSSISMDGSSTGFVYDGAGKRVKKISPNGTTIYISQYYEITDGSPASYIFANGHRLALVRQDDAPLNALYYHQDHLGSTGVVTDALGNVVEEIFYKPFGESALDTGILSVNHKYTGQELDHETGLYNYNARLYDPTIGKFISADTLVPDNELSQAFNRYAYCINNPILYTDPSGNLFSIAALVVSIIKGAFYGAMAGGVIAAIKGEDIGNGMLGGAIAGAFFGAAGVLGNGMDHIVQAGIHAIAGASAGAINASIMGSDIGLGALTGAIGASFAKYFGLKTGIFDNLDTVPGFLTGLVGAAFVGGVTGGIAAELYGGTFIDGFKMGSETAVYGFFFNAAAMKVPKMDFGTAVGRIFKGIYTAFDKLFSSEGLGKAARGLSDAIVKIHNDPVGKYCLYYAGGTLALPAAGTAGVYITGNASAYGILESAASGYFLPPTGAGTATEIGVSFVSVYDTWRGLRFE